jgi:ABC-type transporter Mla subunit MlaD
MRKPRGWGRMDHDEKLEALKDDLDRLYDRVDDNEKTIKKLIEHVDRTFTRLDADISELRQSLARK